MTNNDTAVQETSRPADRVRWGIVGPGGIARKFAADLDHARTADLVAVAGRSVERSTAFAEEFTREGRTVRVHDDHAALFADPDIDAVYIATVHTEHVRLGVQAMDAGKHVLCEKPLAVNHAGAMQLVEAARRNGVSLVEAYMYRFSPQTAKLAELVRDGAIGEVRHVEASFAFATGAPNEHRLRNAETAGGGILDVGGYALSAARLIAGAATGAPFADPTELTGAGTIGESGVDDWATASLRFASGMTANLRCGISLADDNRITVIGSAGRIVVPEPWLPDPEKGSTIEVHRVGRGLESIDLPPTRQWAGEADGLAASIGAGQAREMSWADSLGNAKALDDWRREVGVEYAFEAPTAAVPTANGEPLRVRAGSTMPYATVAGIDKRVSRLVLGCDNQRTLPHASAVFDDFVERGGNAFDTAWLYGKGLMERLLGQWIANRGIRDDVVVIGKGAHTPFCDPESLSRQLLESLDRLQTDHLDLYLMHRDNPDIPVAEFVDVLDEHRRAGRISAYGVSNWTLDRFREANEYARSSGRTEFAALSNHFGLARALDVPWVGCEHVTDPADREWLEQSNTALFPWSSQARGFFARADRDDTSDAELVRCYYSDDNFERLDRTRQLAAELDVAPTAVALAYVLAQRFPTFALFGPRTIEETRTSMAGLEVELSVEQVAWLDLRDE